MLRMDMALWDMLPVVICETAAVRDESEWHVPTVNSRNHRCQAGVPFVEDAAVHMSCTRHMVIGGGVNAVNDEQL